MVSSPCDFVVHIFQSEIDEIRRYYEEQKQTWGDLFGLWTTSGNVVVHLASDASVQGEEQTLKSFLKKKYMLCRVGKWQYEPNEARNTKPREQEQTASETARRHCARGCYTSRVLLSFGSGNKNNDVQAYFHPEQGAKSCTATLRILGTEASGKTSRNPLRNVPAIQKKLEERKSVNEVKKDPIGGQDQGSVSSSSQVNEHNGKPITAREVYEGQRDLSIISIAQTQQPVSNSGDFINPNSSTSSQSPSNSAGQQPATPGFLSSSNGERILEEVLKEIYPMVQNPQKIDVHRTLTTGYIQVNLEINEAKFEVQFPKTFPDVQAKIFATLPKQQYQSDLKPSKNEEFNTSKSILNALRNFLIMKFSEELCIKIADTFSSAGAVNVQTKNDKQGKRVEHKFEHYRDTYLVTIPVEFPEKSARIYCSLYSTNKMTEVLSKSGQPINNLSEILNAVTYKCPCSNCFSTRRNK